MGIKDFKHNNNNKYAKIPNKICLTTKNTKVSRSYITTPANYTIDRPLTKIPALYSGPPILKMPIPHSFIQIMP